MLDLAVRPRAGFNVGHAMQRNKLIYALADAALVVSADFNKGGTWAGAIEQLEQLNYVPVYVRSTGELAPTAWMLCAAREPSPGQIRTMPPRSRRRSRPIRPGATDAQESNFLVFSGDGESSEVAAQPETTSTPTPETLQRTNTILCCDSCGTGDRTTTRVVAMAVSGINGRSGRPLPDVGPRAHSGRDAVRSGPRSASRDVELADERHGGSSGAKCFHRTSQGVAERLVSEGSIETTGRPRRYVVALQRSLIGSSVHNDRPQRKARKRRERRASS